MNACVIFKSGQLTQSYAPTAKTRGSFIKMSCSFELQPAPSSFKSKMWKDFGFKVLYDAQGVRNLEKEIVICRHCFSELRYVSCIVSWHLLINLYRDMYRILRKCTVAALVDISDMLKCHPLHVYMCLGYSIRGFAWQEQRKCFA